MSSTKGSIPSKVSSTGSKFTSQCDSLLSTSTSPTESAVKSCVALLHELKLAFAAGFPALYSRSDESASATEQRTFACNILEYAVLLNGKVLEHKSSSEGLDEEESAAFDRNFEQLKGLYFDFNLTTTRQASLFSLALLKLLQENRQTEFFFLLERLPSHIKTSNEVKLVSSLQQQLVEGRYNAFLEAAEASRSPSSSLAGTPLYSKLLGLLKSTAQEEIAHCISASYKEISLKLAADLLMMKSGNITDQQIVTFIEDHLCEGVNIVWEQGNLNIAFENDETEAKFGGEQSKEVIRGILSHSANLEKVI